MVFINGILAIWGCMDLRVWLFHCSLGIILSLVKYCYYGSVNCLPSVFFVLFEFLGLAAVAKINSAIRMGDAEKTVAEIMNPEAQLPEVYGFAADLYQRELATLQQQSPEVSITFSVTSESWHGSLGLPVFLNAFSGTNLSWVFTELLWCSVCSDVV